MPSHDATGIAPSRALEPVWEPLLEGARAHRAEAALQAVLKDLDAREGLALEGGSLAGGAAGLAMLYAQLALVRPGEGWEARAHEALDQAIAFLGSSVMGPGLYSGFTGIAWTLDHLRGTLPSLAEDSGEDPNGEIDEALLGYLDQSPWTADYDLISGLAGYAAYGLGRLDRPGGRAVLARALARLEESREDRDGGVTWHTPPSLLPAWQRELNPSGYYNLGLAHGVPAVLVVLARAAAAGHEAARPVLEQAVAWLLAQRLPPGLGGCFANVVPAGDASREPTASRVAWCYGDLGLAVALLITAREAGRPDWEVHALDVARCAAAQPLEAAGVRDGGLCHGAAGNAHLFNRLYQATREAVFREAALRYTDLLLDLRREGRGIGGFEAWMPGREDAGEPWRTVPGLLEGGAGIALALLALLHPVVPAWDRFLLVDVPSTPAGA
jgi:lantibiotic modifying enzyme